MRAYEVVLVLLTPGILLAIIGLWLYSMWLERKQRIAIIGSFKELTNRDANLMLGMARLTAVLRNPTLRNDLETRKEADTYLLRHLMCTCDTDTSKPCPTHADHRVWL